MVSMLMDADQVRALAELAGRAIADVENRGYATVTSSYELAEGVAQLAAEWEAQREALHRLVVDEFGFVGHVNSCRIQLGREEDCTCGYSDIHALGYGRLAVSSSAPTMEETDDLPESP
jgi:hypothetical protein